MNVENVKTGQQIVMQGCFFPDNKEENSSYTRDFYCCLKISHIDYDREIVFFETNFTYMSMWKEKIEYGKKIANVKNKLFEEISYFDNNEKLPLFYVINNSMITFEKIDYVNIMEINDNFDFRLFYKFEKLVRQRNILKLNKQNIEYLISINDDKKMNNVLNYIDSEIDKIKINSLDKNIELNTSNQKLHIDKSVSLINSVRLFDVKSKIEEVRLLHSKLQEVVDQLGENTSQILKYIDYNHEFDYSIESPIVETLGKKEKCYKYKIPEYDLILYLNI